MKKFFIINLSLTILLITYVIVKTFFTYQPMTAYYDNAGEIRLVISSYKGFDYTAIAYVDGEIHHANKGVFLNLLFGNYIFIVTDTYIYKNGQFAPTIKGLNVKLNNDLGLKRYYDYVHDDGNGNVCLIIKAERKKLCLQAGKIPKDILSKKFDIGHNTML
ncbi:hypothetical protein AB2S62_18630 [Vibrio sp. NTOU-M3]|uniref:hypothetical protein n=1 Tax=Vibrio sp. NTOU-M3 TaxID=3234954 RepID=UPI00349FA6FE